jgi:hypothetical protein
MISFCCSDGVDARPRPAAGDVAAQRQRQLQEIVALRRAMAGTDDVFATGDSGITWVPVFRQETRPAGHAIVAEACG